MKINREFLSRLFSRTTLKLLGDIFSNLFGAVFGVVFGVCFLVEIVSVTRSTKPLTSHDWAVLVIYLVIAATDTIKTAIGKIKFTVNTNVINPPGTYGTIRTNAN